jgi:hypothetical protein
MVEGSNSRNDCPKERISELEDSVFKKTVGGEKGKEE